MTLELDLLKVMSDRATLEKHFSRIPAPAMTEEAKFLMGMFKDYFESVPKAEAITRGFDTWLWAVKCPAIKPEKAEAIRNVLTRLHSHTPEDYIIESLARRLHEQAVAEEVAFRCQQYLDGKGEPIDKTFDWFNKSLQSFKINTAEELIADTRILKTWDEVQKTMDEEPGWKWRLNVLNKSFGKLRPRKLILFGARPNKGKTAALLSESLYLIRQFPEGKKVLFVTSEEDPNDIYFRAYCNVINTFGHVPDITHRFQVFHSGSWNTDDLYSIFDAMREEIGIICFNPLYNVKIRGHKERDTNYFEEVSKWSRNIAIEFNCPVFTAAQLSESGDNKKIVDMTHIYFSKTGTPAALDGAVLIGSTNDPNDDGYRWINIAKNKFFAPDKLKDPNMISVWGKKVAFDGANSILKDLDV